jgi:diacylglycerol kinase family enzyme
MSQRALFIVFANSNQFGYNITIAPEASLVDGLMDICIVNKPKIYNLPYIANLLLFRKIESSSLVKIIKAKKVIVTRKKKRVVNIDGEPIKFNKKLEVTINPLSLNIIINPNGSKV